MNKACEKCGRGPSVANNRSHAMNATKRLMRINLTRYKGQDICTRCVRTMTKKGMAHKLAA